MNRSRIQFTLALIALFCAPQLVAAQGKKKKRKSNRTNIKATGVIKGVNRGVMLMETDEGDRYYVRSSGRRGRRGNNGFKYTAKADASWLHRGLAVAFRGKVTKKGKILEEIGEIAVFTPSAEKKLGVKQDITSQTSKLFKDVPDAGAKKKKKKKKPKKGKRTRTKRKIPSTPYLIAGRVTRIKNGEITVQVARITLKAKVAENAKITVDVTTPAWIRIGDKVTVSGYYVGERKQYVTANQIAVESQDTLTSKKKQRARSRKKKTRRPRRRSTTKKSTTKKSSQKKSKAKDK